MKKPDAIFVSKEEVISGKIKDKTLSAMAKMTAKQIYTQGYVAGELVTQSEIWNAAIEAAMDHFKNHWVAPDVIIEQLQRLKK